MCKVLLIPGIKRQHQEKVQQILDKVVEPFARIDDDGFGYAKITSKGTIFGEKWIRKDDVFKLHHQPPPDDGFEKASALFGRAAESIEGGAVDSTKVYDSFGERSEENIDDTVAVIFHARKKTQGDKLIQNTHPFYEIGDKHAPDTAIIHNGSIVNHMALTKKYSTCDSEVILHEYLNESMYYNAYGVEQVAKHLVGDYTVGALSSIEYTDGSVTPILDIFKSNKDLYGCYVKEIETVVFCTSDWILKQVLRDLNFTFTCMAKLKDGFLIRINAITGERIDELVPFELSKRTSVYSPPAVQHNHPMPNVTHLRDQNIEVIKRKFQARNGDLFNEPYYDLDAGLTPEERSYFEEMEKDKNTDMKALRLVKRFMNA